jgi:hypothetical protein
LPPKVTNFNTGEEIDIEDIDSIDEIEQNKGITVKTPSGAEVSLLTEDEARFYNQIAAQYQEHNKFNNISDLLELDRVLNLEVLCFRQSTWALLESDYDGKPVIKDLQKNIKELSREIRDIKAGLGIDKKTRDMGKGDTIAEKWENLKRRALEFGYMRNEQLIRSHTNWKELEAMVTGYKNSTDPERTQFNLHLEDILEWLEVKFEEFNEIDEAFKKNQAVWIQEFKI